MNIFALRALSSSKQSASFLLKAGSSPLEGLWLKLRLAAENRLRHGSLSATLIQTIILDSESLPQSLSRTLSHQQTDALLAPSVLEKRLSGLYERHPDLVLAASRDLEAVVARDPAVTDALTPFLYFKGFHALQIHRLAHVLWLNGETDDALLLQNRSSLLYDVDIHPAAKIGSGIMLDHATGLVIGETAIVEDHVSILHNVTLGGTGKEQGDRHPKVRSGVMIGAGASILGNVEIGAGACIAAGSVVLRDVPPHTTVAGIPAKIVGAPRSARPADEMDQAVIPENH